MGVFYRQLYTYLLFIDSVDDLLEFSLCTSVATADASRSNPTANGDSTVTIQHKQK